MQQSIGKSSGVLLLSLAFAVLAAPSLGRARTPSPSVQVPDGLDVEDWPGVQLAYLEASNADGGDKFGRLLAVSGDTVVVGAPWEECSSTGVNGDQSDNSAYRAGAVYVFVRSGTTWSQEAYLKASNTDAGDEFGCSVAISGDTVVVGAEYEDSSATGVNGDQGDDSARSAGAAYVFVRSGTTWSQEAYLKASNTDAGDGFGHSVAVSGDTVVVGADHEDSAAIGVNGDQGDNSAEWSGAAYVFVRNGTTWSQEAYLKSSNTDQGDLFGESLGASGDTVVVGAHWEDSGATGVNGDQGDNSTEWSGAAYVFVRSGTTWSQEAYLKASNTDEADLFGAKAAVSGDTVVIGARGEDSYATGVDGDQSDNSAADAGAAYVFERSGTTWSQAAYLKASNTASDDSFGVVAVSGDLVVVGAPKEDSDATGVHDGYLRNAGAAYVFARSGATWSHEAYVKASDTTADGLFGLSVAASGSTLVAGAPNNSPFETGAVYLFEPPLASSTFRNAGANPASYMASPPVLGSTWTASVDLTTTGHSLAQILCTTAPVTQTLARGQVLLVGGTTFLTLPPRSGPIATWAETVPDEPALRGLRLFTQAAHVKGVSTFALSNAQDLVFGY